jgi:hypothetical protein
MAGGEQTEGEWKSCKGNICPDYCLMAECSSHVAGGKPMTKLIVMFVLLGGQSGPTIQGWNSIEACNAAKDQVVSFVRSRQGSTSYVNVEVMCLELPNKS